MHLKTVVHLNRAQTIIALASIGAVAILLPIAIPYWRDETVGSHATTVYGDRACVYVQDARFHYDTSMTSPSFMHSNGSVNVDAQLEFTRGCNKSDSGIAYLMPALPRNIKCNLFAPDFESVRYSTGNPEIRRSLHSCSWLIAPKHTGRGLLVVSFLDPDGRGFYAYRAIKVGDSPFSPTNISTLLGILSGAGALYTALHKPNETKTPSVRPWASKRQRGTKPKN